jgi:hypothetical protein
MNPFWREPLICYKGGGGGTPGYPASSPPPAPPPTATTFEVQQKRRESLLAARKKRGTQASVIAGETGGTGVEPTTAGTILGDVGFRK